MGLPQFRHPEDTLAFRNETVWSYALDPRTGRQIHQPREPAPDYTLRCFVMTRAVKLFHFHAVFDHDRSAVGAEELRRLVRSVLARSPRRVSRESERVVFPGFQNLRCLSEHCETLLKAEAGGAWRSYFQRGHWRMVFPVTRSNQEREAFALGQAVRQNLAPGAHVFTFPALTINHAIIPYSVDETPLQLIFKAYDPNAPDGALELIYDRALREFRLPATAYFIGGPVKVYQVYCGPLR